MVAVSVIFSIFLHIKNYFQFSLERLLKEDITVEKTIRLVLYLNPSNLYCTILILCSTKSIGVHARVTKVLLYEYCVAGFVFSQGFGFPDRKRYHQYQKTLHAD